MPPDRITYRLVACDRCAPALRGKIEQHGASSENRLDVAVRNKEELPTTQHRYKQALARSWKIDKEVSTGRHV